MDMGIDPLYPYVSMLISSVFRGGGCPDPPPPGNNMKTWTFVVQESLTFATFGNTPQTSPGYTPLLIISRGSEIRLLRSAWFISMLHIPGGARRQIYIQSRRTMRNQRRSDVSFLTSYMSKPQANVPDVIFRQMTSYGGKLVMKKKIQTL